MIRWTIIPKTEESFLGEMLIMATDYLFLWEHLPNLGRSSEQSLIQKDSTKQWWQQKKKLGRLGCLERGILKQIRNYRKPIFSTGYIFYNMLNLNMFLYCYTMVFCFARFCLPIFCLEVFEYMFLKEVVL